MFPIEVVVLLLFNFGNCDSVNITVLHLGESVDTATNDAIIMAANHINDDEKMDTVVDVISYHFQSKEDIQTVCARITEEVTPDLILDTTRIPQNAYTAEKIAVSYGRPTISTSNNLQNYKYDELKKKYDPKEMFMFKVATPSYTYISLVEEIINLQGMTNVAFIYQPEFVTCKNLQWKLNSRGIPCIFLEYTPKNNNKLIEIVTKMYFLNIFLLGDITIPRSDWLKNQVVYSIRLNGSKIEHDADVYAWPIVKLSKLEKFITKVIGVDVNTAFYFELAMTGILAAKNFVTKTRPEYKDCYCDSKDNYPNRTNLNFRFYLVQETFFTKILLMRNNETQMVFDINIVKNEADDYTPLGLYKVQYNSSFEIPEEAPWNSIKPTSHYKVLARLKPPFIYFNQTTNKAYGYNIDLLNTMASILGFTYEITVINVNYSDFYTNNSDGFIGEMISRGMDIGLGPVYPSVYYSSEVGFSIPYYKPVGIKFVMKRSKDDSIFTFITVLEAIVWICILSAFFINSFMLWLAERVSPYSYRNDRERYKDVEETRDFTVKECLWFCLTSLTPQGGGIVPQHFSGRLVVVTWWLFGFIILASYTANLAAFLTLSKLKNPIESFTDLYRQFRMHYAPLNGSDEEAYFMNMAMSEELARSIITVSEYPLPNKYQRMKQIILNSTFPNTVEEALVRVYESKTATDGFAFLVDSMDARYLLLTRCNLIDIEEEVGKRPLVIALPRYTLLKHDIDKALTIIMENRWHEDLEKKWWDNNPYRATNCVELEDESEGIGIYNIGGVFLIIFIGIGIVSMTIAYDYWRYLHRQKARVTPVTPITANASLEDTAVEEIEMPKKNEEVNNASTLQHRNVTRY